MDTNVSLDTVNGESVRLSSIMSCHVILSSCDNCLLPITSSSYNKEADINHATSCHLYSYSVSTYDLWAINKRIRYWSGKNSGRSAKTTRSMSAKTDDVEAVSSI